MTDERLREIRERAEAATPGPWDWADDGTRAIVGNLDRPHPVIARLMNETRAPPLDGEDLANAAFIAAAREDVPALLAALATVTAERDRLAKAIREYLAMLDGDRPHTPYASALVNVRAAVNVLDAAATGERRGG